LFKRHQYFLPSPLKILRDLCASAVNLFMFRWPLIGAALILLPLAPVLADGPGDNPAPPPVSPRFGVVEAFYRPDDARALGVGWERIIFEWAQFQPDGPGDFNTDAVPEEWLLDAQRGGREVVGLIKNTPPWASDSHKLGAPPAGLDLPIDDPDNLWAAFVQRLVKYYGETWGIRHWIIYNEPDLRPGEIGWYEFDGDVTDYAHMLKVAYLAAKTANPDAVIHMAGMAWWTDVAAYRRPYMQRLLDVISNDPDARANSFYFDVAMVHTYFGTFNVWKQITQTRDILWYFGLRDKQIWIDETNASPSTDPYAVLPPGPPQFAVSLDQQADYLIQAAALSLAAGVERLAVYRLYDNHYSPGLTEPWGLVRGDGTRRPAFDAYHTAIELFSPTQRATRYYSDRSSLVTLEQPDRTIYVMWARKAAPVQFYVMAADADEIATRVNVSGVTWTVQPQAAPDAEGLWFSVKARSAIPDDNGLVMVEGSPVILMVDGPPRTVWIEVQGSYWTLRGPQ
jgi:hypothetical protein